MGEIVGGFVMPHDPLIFVNPKKADRSVIFDAYEEIRSRVEALEATTAVIVGADHYILFGPACLPQFLIGVGDAHGPVDQLPGLSDEPAGVNEALALHIRDRGLESGLAWATSKSLGYDHSIGAPAQLCVPEGVAIVPVYLASGVAPYLPMHRAHEIGRSIRAAVESFPGDERVVVMGSGGISHWVGEAQMGRINPEFDRRVLEAVTGGRVDDLLSLSDDEIREQGGIGAMEIRQFVCAMGAAPGPGGEIIAYEAWEGGVTGLGFAALEPGA